jgi:hypothetical protein
VFVKGRDVMPKEDKASTIKSLVSRMEALEHATAYSSPKQFVQQEFLQANQQKLVDAIKPTRKDIYHVLIILAKFHKTKIITLLSQTTTLYPFIMAYHLP